ncbi:unnamed protein product [Adineta steineri]|uniref:Uncharacterized protein n=1 Tax=Adineta steineri TaxID=433720 RepID=A0A818HUR6_9BILA|nr:unnamed protein product [Adineta steineri]CAF3512393.1 unnamed protein product [Adineta steineri]
MDSDTVFPGLSDDERIVGKYTGAESSQVKKVIVILTNFRILIRWKEMVCGCFAHSSYSSIRLDSIDRIDDTRSNENLTIFFVFMLLAGIPSIICGFVFKLTWLISVGIIFTIFGVLIFISACFCNKKKYITLKGSFGSETIIFEKTIAREFEGQLSKMIHQRSIQCLIEQTDHNGSRLLPESSASMASKHIIGTAMKVGNTYGYELLQNVA